MAFGIYSNLNGIMCSMFDNATADDTITLPYAVTVDSAVIIITRYFNAATMKYRYAGVKIPAGGNSFKLYPITVSGTYATGATGLYGYYVVIPLVFN